MLDLFAGIGGITIEAASRGCKSIASIDQNHASIKWITQVSRDFGFQSIQATKSEARKWLNRCQDNFDLVFADPPYDYEYYEVLIDLVLKTAELAYKAKYQKYTGSMDTLINFIKTDSLNVIKAFGEVPDGMTLENALDSGFVSRDTVPVSVFDSLFGSRHMDGRVHPFAIDSLGLVPFTKGGKFELEAGIVERSGAKVPVFRAKDGAPFDKSDPRMVGSLNDPKTNGNWE